MHGRLADGPAATGPASAFAEGVTLFMAALVKARLAERWIAWDRAMRHPLPARYLPIVTKGEPLRTTS